MDLSKLSQEELRDLAADRQVVGRNEMSEDELRAALAETEDPKELRREIAKLTSRMRGLEARIIALEDRVQIAPEPETGEG